MATALSVSWEELSSSTRDAFALAVGCLTGASPEEQVQGSGDRGVALLPSGALLVGILLSHDGTSEPEQLLEHFDRSRQDLERALAEIPSAGPETAPFDPTVKRWVPLEEIPPLMPDAEEILRVALELARSKPSPPRTLPLRFLFGGVLQAAASDAYRALEVSLAGVIRLPDVARSYVDFLQEGADAKYSDFLVQRHPKSNVAASAPPQTETVTGIDVSHHLGKIDWARVAEAGIVFAGAKATEGSGFVDSAFAENWVGMRAAGIPVRVAYHLLRPKEPAEKQAEHFLQVLREAGGLEAGELAAVEFESNDGVPPAAVLSAGREWLSRVGEATGRPAVVYTNAAFWRTLGDPSDEAFAASPLWVASYGPTYTLPPLWSRAWIWQYSNGRDLPPVPGIFAAVNRDRLLAPIEEILALAPTPWPSAEPKPRPVRQRAPRRPERPLNIRPRALSDQASEEDTLGFATLVKALYALINAEETDLPLAIAITAPWGGGKSSVMKQLRKMLHEPPSEAPSTRRWHTVWFDSWKYEKSERLWAALAKAMYEQPQARMNKRERVRFKGRVERRRQGWVPFLVRGLGPAVVAAGAGAYALAANEPQAGGPLLTGSFAALVLSVGRYWGALSEPFKRAIDGYVNRPKYPEQLGFTPEANDDVTKMIQGLLAEPPPEHPEPSEDELRRLPPLVRARLRARRRWAKTRTFWRGLGAVLAWPWKFVSSLWRVDEPEDSAKQPCLAFFVDDLDRCGPTQVVEVVNAINQIFNSVNGRRCVFVLGMDRDVVAASIDVVYRDTINTLTQHHSELGRSFGLQFLAKLVQMSVAIPRPADDALKRHLASLTKNDVPDEASARPSEARVVEIQSAIEAEKPADLTEVAAIEQRLAAEVAGPPAGGRPDAGDETASRARAEEEAAVREAARRSRARRLNADDPKVWQAEQDAVPVLAGNPRQVKRFDNAYRLQLHVALNSEHPPEFTPSQLAVMAKWVAIRLRWPSLATAMDANPDLVEALEKHANGKSEAVPDEWKAFEEWFTMPELSEILTERSRSRRLRSLSHAFLNVT